MWNIFSCISWPTVHLLFRFSIHFFLIWVVYFCRLSTFLRKHHHEQIWPSHSAQAESQCNTPPQWWEIWNSNRLHNQTHKNWNLPVAEKRNKGNTNTCKLPVEAQAETSIQRKTWRSEVKSRKWDLHSQPQPLMCNNVHSTGKDWKPPKWLAEEGWTNYEQSRIGVLYSS